MSVISLLRTNDTLTAFEDIFFFWETITEMENVGRVYMSNIRTNSKNYGYYDKIVDMQMSGAHCSNEFENGLIYISS